MNDCLRTLEKGVPVVGVDGFARIAVLVAGLKLDGARTTTTLAREDAQDRRTQQSEIEVSTSCWPPFPSE